MALWLFKEEPEHYSFEDLERDGQTIWNGVSNNMALKNLRQVRKGDRVLFYATGKLKAVMGEMEVVDGSRPDTESDNPRAVVVTVKAGKRLSAAVPLERIKKDKQLADWDLVRLPRLSVVPVNRAQWKRILDMGQGLTAT
jgi:predicted RNA-binding protein with PUA-like domain